MVRVVRPTWQPLTMTRYRGAALLSWQLANLQEEGIHTAPTLATERAPLHMCFVEAQRDTASGSVDSTAQML